MNMACYLPSLSGWGIRKSFFRRALDMMSATVPIGKIKSKLYFVGYYGCITSTSPVPQR
jgi:hypothetical protein